MLWDPGEAAWVCSIVLPVDQHLPGLQAGTACVRAASIPHPPDRSQNTPSFLPFTRSNLSILLSCWCLWPVCLISWQQGGCSDATPEGLQSLSSPARLAFQLLCISSEHGLQPGKKKGEQQQQCPECCLKLPGLPWAIGLGLQELPSCARVPSVCPMATACRGEGRETGECCELLFIQTLSQGLSVVPFLSLPCRGCFVFFFTLKISLSLNSE